MPGSRTLVAVMLLVAACGGGGQTTVGAGGLTCDRYCGIMDATCVGSDAQYGGLIGSCESYCGTTNAWPVGTSQDQTVNTLGCRITHAILALDTAAATRTMHCGHAGPSGGDACGTWCDNYCFLALKNCTGANATGLGFTDQASCLAACNGLSPSGAIDSTSGNTVQCRIYYAGAASTSPVPYCGYAQIVSSSTVGGAAASGPCN